MNKTDKIKCQVIGCEVKVKSVYRRTLRGALCTAHYTLVIRVFEGKRRLDRNVKFSDVRAEVVKTWCTSEKPEA